MQMIYRAKFITDRFKLYDKVAHTREASMEISRCC